MVAIKFSNPAKKQLKEIHFYIKKDSPKNAGHVVATILKKIQSLSRYPEIGKPIAISRRGIVRQVHVFKYRIFYCYYENQIEILAFYHFSMDIDIDRNIITPFNLSDE